MPQCYGQKNHHLALLNKVPHDPIAQEKVRVDKYLWAIRIYKTRRLAADACNRGKVKLKGANVKPSKLVSVGDEYDIKTGTKKWIIEVNALLNNRVKFNEAIKYYTDISPVEVIDKTKPTVFVFDTGKRKSKQGRPTKKEKRKLDDFLG